MVLGACPHRRPGIRKSVQANPRVHANAVGNRRYRQSPHDAHVKTKLNASPFHLASSAARRRRDISGSPMQYIRVHANGNCVLQYHVRLSPRSAARLTSVLIAFVVCRRNDGRTNAATDVKSSTYMDGYGPNPSRGRSVSRISCHPRTPAARSVGAHATATACQCSTSGRDWTRAAGRERPTEKARNI